MSNNPENHLDLATVRDRLRSTGGRKYWRSLDELAATPGFADLLHREFPRQAIGWSDDENPGEGRRNFLKLMGASLALAGLTACTRQPTEHIVPYVRQPEELIPGRPLFFASAATLGGVANGVLVESHEGRPTKIEGNPEHPATLGACDIFSQASVLQLYDPDRAQAPTLNGEISGWGSFFGSLRAMLTAQKAKNGAGLRILTETITSPTVAEQLKGIQKLYPAAKWHQWEPAGPHSARAASMQAFGQPQNTYYDFSKADVVVALDSDFLASGVASLRYARQFSARRRVSEGKTNMNRLYVAEPMPTATGSKADHRMPLRAGDVEELTWALATTVQAAAGGPKTNDNGDIYRWAEKIGADLLRSKGASVVIAGEYQSPMVHALAHAINAKLGNVGTTVFYTDPIEANPTDQLASLQDLAKDLDSGVVDVLLILSGNPVFTAPADLGMAARIQKAKTRVHLSLFRDETSQVCQWHLPEAHFLESWGDARAFDGTVSIQQPLIAPLYQGRSACEILQSLSESPEMNPYVIVKNYWSSQHAGADFDAWWRRAVHDGVIAGTALPQKTPALHGEGLTAHAQKRTLGGKLEVNFRPDPTIYDGRFANNGWLQELPKPITKMTWDNAVYMNPGDAHRLGVETGSMVELSYEGRRLKAPVRIQPGHVDGSVTLHFGYGRTHGGRSANGAGFDVYPLRTSKALWQDVGLEASKVSGSYEFADTQMEGVLDPARHIIHKGTIAEYLKDPEAVHDGAEAPAKSLTLYPGFNYQTDEEGRPKYAWGMAIDLNSCTGCTACIVACQAENNIAVVGKDQVRRGRNMQWLRVDTYYAGTAEDPNPEFYNQPIPCMQCENAPCELVCPVQATSHSAEGLNDMVYNRCVGTRYCSNNCPYKVRRFNFYLFSDYETPSLKLLHNPDVTVRSRGVMEKCTYCVQRINAAKMDAEKQDRRLQDGEIQTACQASCPTEAIIFGDINDPNSRVSKMKSQKRNYGLLEDINTRPRTTYLATLRNPNPEWES
ncbi:MAG TPA: TAT-variant-translocated molybdopterin oxidoreductase [Bryobacteraceae bacterium]|jgi:molybdopterin-containing oxidoreductase family iron-sulfur binding subunit|nr:TAT-variant-translocated molybdopterin oxidoreductase [Bryobacteraceae bacterium]